MIKAAQFGLIVIMLVLLASCNAPLHKGYELEIGWIGTASINDDGEITLVLRSKDENGKIAHGYFSYPTDHEDYQRIKRHVGELAVGELKPIPPFEG
ncbi:MAG: hypothetical protein R3273_11960 [Pseudidiomarina maritima]|nr:hypothetical protein [Pseudidiomarina maritima]